MERLSQNTEVMNTIETRKLHHFGHPMRQQKYHLLWNIRKKSRANKNKTPKNNMVEKLIWVYMKFTPICSFEELTHDASKNSTRTLYITKKINYRNWKVKFRWLGFIIHSKTFGKHMVMLPLNIYQNNFLATFMVNVLKWIAVTKYGKSSIKINSWCCSITKCFPMQYCWVIPPCNLQKMSIKNISK